MQRPVWEAVDLLGKEKELLAAVFGSDDAVHHRNLIFETPGVVLAPDGAAPRRVRVRVPRRSEGMQTGVYCTGNLNLGGMLAVSLINGFMPTAGNSFDLFDWASLDGTFASMQLPTLPGGLTWNISQLYTTGVLSVGGVLGDYNHNGVVDGAD